MAQVNSQPPFPFSPAALGANHLYVVAIESGTSLLEVQFNEATPKLDDGPGSALMMAVWQLGKEFAKSDVKQVQLGEEVLIFTASKYTLFVLQARQDANVALCHSFLKYLAGIFDRQYGSVFDGDWNGDVSQFNDFRSTIDVITAGAARHRQRDEFATIRSYMFHQSILAIRDNFRTKIRGSA
jgi:hypothetical protein